MSDSKLIGISIADMATDPNDTIRQCPYVQAFLKANTQQVDSTNNVSTHNDLNDWLDNQDVMFKLHMSLRTLQTLRSNGTLPYSRIRNKIYYRRKDVERLLNDNYSKKGGHQ